VNAPLPRAVPWSLLGAAVALALLASGIAWQMPTLRQGRLIEAADRVTRARHDSALARLAQEGEIAQAVLAERQAATERRPLLLSTDDDKDTQAWLTQLVQGAGLTLQELQFGTRRAGESLAVVPAELVVLGDRVELPPFLERFYAQERALRLVSLDVESPEYGDVNARARLKWEFAAPPRPEAAEILPDPQFAPPGVASAPTASVARVNRGRWGRLQASADELAALGPRLRRLAGLEAELAELRRQSRGLQRWQAASKIEGRSLLRKLPSLLKRVEVGAMGQASLRPGPGGALQITE